MKKFSAWPFLISRNRTDDYRVIVAPDFLVNKGQVALLYKGIRDDAQKDVIIGKVSDPEHGILSFVYRKTPALINRGEPARDSVGRPIPLIEGIVINNDLDGYRIPTEALTELHAQMSTIFQKFWLSGRDFQVIPSSKNDIDLPVDKNALPLILLNENKSEWLSSSTHAEKRIKMLTQERTKTSKWITLGIVLIATGIISGIAGILMALIIVGVPLAIVGIPLAVVGCFILLIGVWMVAANSKRHSEFDAEIKKLRLNK